MTKVGIAPLGPKIVPINAFVNGINKASKIINGTERKILIIPERNKFTHLFSKLLPGLVKYKNKPRAKPIINT